MRTVAWSAWRSRESGAARLLLDVRSPVEFGRGAVPGAVNFPLLSDAERHAIGTLYVQEGRHAAVTAGLELFAAKAERLANEAHALAPPGAEIYVHCARGGMRSQLMALWLRSLGFHAVLVDGGYKSYRASVLIALGALERHPLLVLDGLTGAGKSELLRELALAGAAVLDFEAYARHRGSAFGDFALPGPRPSQQGFENELAEAYLRVRHAPTLLVEIESQIGDVELPSALRKHVYTSPAVLISRDREERAARLAAVYAAGWTDADDERFVQRCQLIRPYVARADVERIISAVLARDFLAASRLLLELRYDPVYRRGMAKRTKNIVAELDLTHHHADAVRFILERIGTGLGA